MRRLIPRRAVAALIAVLPLVAIAACNDTSGPGLFSPFVAGTWDLVSSTGSPYTSGRLVLTAAGGAELRLSGSYSGEPVNTEYDGTFRLERDGRVQFSFVEPPVSSRPNWMPSGSIEGDHLEIRYPNPADGPDIVLAFVRM